MAYVYRHVRLDKNEPFYIGVGSSKNHKRAKEKSKSRRGKIWHDIANKTSYRVDILFDDISLTEANLKEVEFINIYGRRDLGTGTLVNLTSGGEGVLGNKITDNTRLKLSEAAKKRGVQPQLEKIIWYRKNVFVFTDEIRQKISDKNKGKKISEKQKNELSKNRKGILNPMYGVKGKNHKSFKGYVTVFVGEYNIGLYEGVNDCASKLNLSASKISRCLNGKAKTHFGYSFLRA